MNNVQDSILKSSNKFQLVSAGAGSGKTTTMVKKICNLILNENVDVDNLLVVTFTVLAANEMKERLVAKLKEQILISTDAEKEKILNIIEKVKTANIDTIDGFNSKTIKKYFYELNISPNIEIISDAVKDYFLTLAMKKTIKDFSANAEEVNLMLDLFGGNRRNFDHIQELVLEVYNNIINLEDYNKFLEKAQNEYVDSLISEQILNAKICKQANRIETAIQHSFSLFTPSVQAKLQTCLDEAKKLNNKLSFKTNLLALNGFNGITFSSTEKKENEEIVEINKEIKKLINLKAELIENQIDDNFEEKNQKIIEYLSIFMSILKNFIKNYNNLKEKNNLIDFNDLNRLMLKLLENENIKTDLQNKFKYIFIDEYQDVNPLQDKLMSSLVGSNTSIFMVGDVKQSIYGFRGSSPEWFISKYNNLKNGDGQGEVFDMNLNFRSSPKILNFINEIFSSLMTEYTSDINYKRDALIEPQRDDITDGSVEMIFVKDPKERTTAQGLYSVKNHKQEQSISSKEIEAQIVVQKITELYGTKFYDANTKEYRKLTYSDIAILTHSEKDENATILIDMLRENAIPVNKTNKLEVSKSEGIKLILSILKCVIGTADDVDYLASFLALTDATIDDVALIRHMDASFKQNLTDSQNEKVSKFFAVLEDVRNATYVRNNFEIFNFILNTLKLRYFILKKPNGGKELGLIEEFLNKLSSIENSLNLSEFIDLVESNVNRGSDFNETDSEDSVTIQTIHKSKGLEYPVVILFNCGKIFSYLRENGEINFNSSIGLGFDYFDTSNRIKYNSLTKMAVKFKNEEKGYKEELRLLYVALTRAKNKLIITGNYTEKALTDDEINKNSYTNMLISCFADKLTGDYTQLKNCTIELKDAMDEVPVVNDQEDKEVELLFPDFKYSNQNKFNISLKNSVTGLNSQANQNNGFKITNVFKPFEQYNAEEERAIIGTHYHSALESLDYFSNYSQTTNFLDVDYSKIHLAHSIISNLVKGAVNVKKEAEFMMYVPYNQVVESEIEDKVLIQGVVDLLIEFEDKIVIVDYKFSRLPIKILKEKYAEQLKLYKLAVENAYKKPVEQMYIYSIETGELF